MKSSTILLPNWHDHGTGYHDHGNWLPRSRHLCPSRPSFAQVVVSRPLKVPRLRYLSTTITVHIYHDHPTQAPRSWYPATTITVKRARSGFWRTTISVKKHHDHGNKVPRSRYLNTTITVQKYYNHGKVIKIILDFLSEASPLNQHDHGDYELWSRF